MKRISILHAYCQIIYSPDGYIWNSVVGNIRVKLFLWAALVIALCCILATYPFRLDHCSIKYAIF